MLSLVVRSDLAASTAAPIVYLRGGTVTEPSHGPVGRVTTTGEGEVWLEVDGDLLARLNAEPRPAF